MPLFISLSALFSFFKGLRVIVKNNDNNKSYDELQFFSLFLKELCTKCLLIDNAHDDLNYLLIRLAQRVSRSWIKNPIFENLECLISL